MISHGKKKIKENTNISFGRASDQVKKIRITSISGKKSRSQVYIYRATPHWNKKDFAEHAPVIKI